MVIFENFSPILLLLLVSLCLKDCVRNRKNVRLMVLVITGEAPEILLHELFNCDHENKFALFPYVHVRKREVHDQHYLAGFVVALIM